MAERVRTEYLANGWPDSGRQKVCNTVLKLGRKAYWEFHEGVNTVWRVERRKRGLVYTGYYCDAHLPDEFRTVPRG